MTKYILLLNIFFCSGSFAQTTPEQANVNREFEQELRIQAAAEREANQAAIVEFMSRSIGHAVYNMGMKVRGKIVLGPAMFDESISSTDDQPFANLMNAQYRTDHAACRATARRSTLKQEWRRQSEYPPASGPEMLAASAKTTIQVAVECKQGNRVITGQSRFAVVANSTALKHARLEPLD